jgi:hypothetical protein
MSLLDRGRQAVTVFPEETVTDSDGNPFTRASAVGIDLRAEIQPLSSTEDADGGFVTESRFRLRLAGQRGAAVVLGPRSQVQWKGNRYSIEGNGREHFGSPATTRVEYVMMRG